MDDSQDISAIQNAINVITKQLVILKAVLAPQRQDIPGHYPQPIPPIAEQIVAWRTAYDWTQDDLAKEVGMSQSVISHFEDPAYGRYSVRSLQRLAEAFGTTLTVYFDTKDLLTRGWQSIDTAPKDGRAVLLLSAPQTVDMGPNGIVHHPPRVAIGHWDPDGDAWVDEMGRLDGDAYRLAVTGVWFSGHGWFQPNEVTHWQPLPEPPEGAVRKASRLAAQEAE